MVRVTVHYFCITHRAVTLSRTTRNHCTTAAASTFLRKREDKSTQQRIEQSHQRAIYTVAHNCF